MLVDLLVDVAALLEATVTVEKVAVTPGEPAASDKCSAVYVWGSQIFDAGVGTQERSQTGSCVYRRAYVINYRIDICHNVNVEEQSTDDMLAEAQSIYDKADLAWCAIAHAASAKTLFNDPNTTQCEDITLGAITIGAPVGDRISASGTIRVTHPCPPEGS